MLFPTYLCSCKCQLIQKEGEPCFFPNLNAAFQETKGKGRVVWNDEYRISGITFCRGEAAWREE